MWLRYNLVSNKTQLALYRHQFRNVSVIADANMDPVQLRQLYTAAYELQNGLTKLLGTPVFASCCKVPPPGTKEPRGTLYVEVGRDFSKFGAEGFKIGRTDDGDVTVQAMTPSGALYGSFRLLSYLQREERVPGPEFVSIPAMPLRIWDLWDDLTGDITRGFAGDSLVWPMALWPDPDDPSTAPAPTKLYVARCNSSDPLQHWQGKLLDSPGIAISAIRNQGMDQCIASAKSAVVSCGSPDAATLFYNTTSYQLSIGPLVPGQNASRICLDINHAQGPDIDHYRCHPLGERDYQNQVSYIRGTIRIRSVILEGLSESGQLY
jgi:hypothetical protein